MKFEKVILIVLDGLGVGELPDAKDFGDTGSNTLLHVLEKQRSLELPHLSSLGLTDLVGAAPANQKFQGHYLRMKEVSAGKDTTTGHWEMMGLKLEKSFDHFDEGFSPETMSAWIKEMKLSGYLGNKAASGTEIIKELGEEHLSTGKPIVYTSADSVFQIACHESSFGLDRLLKLCEDTRAFFNRSSHMVGRVIARPFLGEDSKTFYRTENRKDFSLKPFGKTLLDFMKEAGLEVVGVGKIPSIFDYEGITEIIKATNDSAGVEQSLQAMKDLKKPGIIFTNLNDLDSLYAHRRNPEGYAENLQKLDAGMGRIIEAMGDKDLLLITADHGNDPTFKGSDHTREYVPLLIYHRKIKAGRRLQDRESFSDLGQSLSENFKLPRLANGESFLSEII